MASRRRWASLREMRFFQSFCFRDLVFSLQVLDCFLLATVDPARQTDQENVPGAQQKGHDGSAKMGSD
jgi:hypothetical protein